MDTRTINALSLLKILGALLVIGAHYLPLFYETAFFSFGTGCFFLAAGYYALNWEKSRGFPYLLKRLARLYPGYLMAVIAYLVAAPDHWHEWPTLLLHHMVFLLSAASTETVFALNPAFWSLPVFMTFFILAAFIKRPHPSFKGVAFFLPLPFITLWLGGLEWRDGYLQLLAFPLFFYAFWLGGAIGQKQQDDKACRTQYTVMAVVLTGLIVMAGMVYGKFNPGGHKGYTFLYEEGMTFLYGALLWSLLHSRFAMQRHPLIERAGALSFGIYLFHNFPTHFLAARLPDTIALVLSFFITLLLATASLYIIERPMQRYLKAKLIAHRA